MCYMGGKEVWNLLSYDCVQLKNTARNHKNTPRKLVRLTLISIICKYF